MVLIAPTHGEIDRLSCSDVKSRDSVLPQDSLETVLRCLGLGIGLGMVSLVKKQDNQTL